MYNGTTKPTLIFKRWAFTALAATIALSSCKKDSHDQLASTAEIKTTANPLPVKTNPFSLRNIQKAKATINATSRSTQRNAEDGIIDSDPQFVYFKFNPRELTQEQFLAIENDSTVQLLDIPFANMSMYSDEFALDEAKAETLKDGNIYGVTSTTNTNVLSKLSSRPQTQTQYLDTLVKVADTDTTLQFQAFREAGYTEDMLNRFRICLFKKPHGYVNYWDNQLNRYEPVRGMQVWSLFLGIPIYTYSDGNGYYEIPWRYSIGTIMGTKAKNGRVNVKPLDTHGSIVRNIYTLLTQFVVGSVHIEGWVTPCQMRDGKDFNFSGHTQVRYWCQILNAYYFHDQYAAADGIKKAPDAMVCYAQWANTNKKKVPIVDADGIPDFGNASTFMLGHLSIEAVLIELFINGLFDGELNLSTDFPNIFNIFTGLLPDMSFRVPQAQEPQLYNSRFAEIAFHELGHASHFRQVGQLWWVNVGRGEIPDRGVSGNPYGDGTYTNAGHVSLTESWAEFIGMNYQLRRYPATAAFNTCTRGRTYFDAISGTNKTITYKRHFPSTQLIENQMFFYGGGDWIPMGLYHDLMDRTNVSPNNPAETWDGIQGVTIKQMYDAFGAGITSWCDYYYNFSTQNPTLNQNFVFQVFDNHHAACY